MDKFLEMHNLQRLNQEEIKNMNRPITSNETKSIIKLSTSKNLGPDSFAGEFYQTLISIFLKLQKNYRGRNTFELTLQDQHHPNTKTKQRHHTQNRKLQASITGEHGCKIQQNICKPNSTIH